MKIILMEQKELNPLKQNLLAFIHIHIHIHIQGQEHKRDISIEQKKPKVVGEFPEGSDQGTSEMHFIFKGNDEKMTPSESFFVITVFISPDKEIKNEHDGLKQMLKAAKNSKKDHSKEMKFDLNSFFPEKFFTTTRYTGSLTDPIPKKSPPVTFIIPSTNSDLKVLEKQLEEWRKMQSNNTAIPRVTEEAVGWRVTVETQRTKPSSPHRFL